MAPSHVLWLALGGALGTLSRAGVAAIMMRWLGRDLPWGTLAVNLLGSFAFGLIFALGKGRLGLPTGLETVVLVGFLGGFTTYSSFAFQSVDLLEQGRLTVALAYVGGTVLVGLLAVWAGLLVGRSLGG
jgi:CrcB protein